MTAITQSTTYSMTTTPIAGDTHTGLDQLVDYIYADNGLAGANDSKDIVAGAVAANRMNKIILEAARETTSLSDGMFNETEVIAMNQYIQNHYLGEWTTLHGDDEDGPETGFHRVQNDGSTLRYRGDNLINTVEDGIYHMGFEIVNGQFLNEDGNPNATVAQVASWLNQFYTDHSTTHTGFDRITNLIMADGGLAAKIPESEIEAGADAADNLNHMILTAMKEKDTDGWITTTDLIEMNQWIRGDAARLKIWTDLHGDDEKGSETGYHLVQNDGANTRYFGQNLVNTVADGIYHMGFEIRNNRFLNEDGDENAYLTDVADWINYFYADQSTTNTGLDKIVDIVKTDTGLAKYTCAGDINQGAYYADRLNHFIIDAVNQTDAMADGWITSEDLVSMNDWIRSNDTRRNDWVMLHGDDEDGSETGYHLVQNDGANTLYFGQNLVNTVADGIYHMGFEIQNGRFLNEDGDENAYLTDVAAWLNYFYKGATLVYGTDSDDHIQGSDDAEDIEGECGDDCINAGGGNDLINGSYGNDTIQGDAGDDILIGGQGNDTLDGGDGSDTCRVTGNKAGGWSSFSGFDTYADTGTTGTDTLLAVGMGNVDIGFTGFGSKSGIEAIDATGATGTVRLLGDWTDDTLDFRNVSLIGTNIVIDGGSGNDTLFGNAAANIMVGGIGNDTLDGGGGSDTYRVTGNKAGGWSSFNGFDTYADTGATGTDIILAIGTGNVDIGLKSFGPSSGIEAIDATGATGTVRLLGDWTDDTLDFRNVSLIGTNIVIDGGSGNDTLFGNAAANIMVGGLGNDTLDGGGGSDTYRVTGNKAGGWSSFNGFDIYADTGATGTDTILAIGTGNVDIGLKSFEPSSGIQAIDATGAAGTVRLLGDWTDDTFDFRNVSLIGTNIVIDGGSGNDTLFGNAAVNIMVGGLGNDTLDGSDGSDTYQVTGNKAGGWSSFNGFDIYADTGATGTDTILAIGTGNVDIGLKSFGPTSGIEAIDATGAAGTVRLLGDWTDDTFDFRNVSLIGTNITIDGGSGKDTIYGNASNNAITGSSGADYLYGLDGSDTLNGGSENDFLFGGEGIDIINGGTGTDRIVYSSAMFGKGDLEVGGRDTIQSGKGDTIDFDALIENFACIQGKTLSAFTANIKVGAVIDASNSFAFVSGTFEVDLNDDGLFLASDDFQIDLGGVSSVTYNAAGDYFMLA